MHRRTFFQNRLPRDTSCNTEGTFSWMPNNKDVDPCDLVSQVLQVCKPGFQLGTLSQQLSCDASNDMVNCCCSTASYALLSACWVCRGNNVSSIHRGYGSFFRDSHCHDPSINLTFPPTIQPQMDQLNIPEWAMLPPDELTNHWNITKAALLAGSLESPIVSAASHSQTSTMPPTSSPITTTSAISSSSPSSSKNKASSSSATIAAAVLGALAGLTVIIILGWFLWRWRRRRRLRPKVGPRVDLADPGVEGKQSIRPLDLLGGEPDRPPRSPTFPFPFEWFFRRYHPDAPHSIEPRSEYADVAPAVSQHVRTRDPVSQLKMPVTAAKSKRPMDQLERDLANLQGAGVRENSFSGKPRPKTKRRLHLSISRRDGSNSQHSSGSPTNSDSRQNRHHSRKSKGKYYHLPPSAQYLADVARYPQSVDPERPWINPQRSREHSRERHVES